MTIKKLEPKSRTAEDMLTHVTVSMPVRLRTQIATYAAEEGMTLSAFLRQLVTWYCLEQAKEEQDPGKRSELLSPVFQVKEEAKDELAEFLGE